MKIPPWKGVGNRPCLFLAYGSISLSNPDGTLCLGTVETMQWNRVRSYEHFLEAEAFKDHVGKGVDEDDSDEDAEGELDPDLVHAVCPITRTRVKHPKPVLRNTASIQNGIFTFSCLGLFEPSYSLPC